MEDDSSWVFDSLICFLNGPVWNAPLQSFIEEKSLIFEANASENPEYHKIFEEYKNLVDLMLGSYMEDIGITPIQFEEACTKGHMEFISKNFDHSLFEQIWAANDYELFKRMMTQRNVELQLQALELIEQKYGITPQSFIPQKTRPSPNDDESKTKANTIDDKPLIDLEEEIMEEVIKKFPHENISAEEKEVIKVDEEVQYLMEEKQILQDALKSIGETSKAQIDYSEPTVETHSEREIKIADEIKNNSSKAKLSDAPTQDEIAFDKKPISTEIDKIELKKRQEYLKAQRDKLVALKKEARKKHLGEDVASKEKLRARPKSAKVAEAVLAGNSKNLEHQQLQIRKALAERLRSEVIGNPDDK